jgi:hypothetical protein
VFSSSGFLSLERQETIHTWGLTGIMSNNVINFQGVADKRRVTDDTEKRCLSDQIDKHGYRQYVLELEHEILELQQQVCALHRDLERERGLRLLTGTAASV